MAFTQICGDVGSGKTLLLTRIVLKQLKRGRRVYCNYDIKTPPEYAKRFFQFTHAPEIYGVKEGVIVFDELPLYWDKSMWRDLPVEMKGKLREYRKDGLDFYATSQYIEDVPSFIYRFISRYLECHSVVAGRIIKTYEMPKHMATRFRRRYRVRYHFFSKSFWGNYDTAFKISDRLAKAEGVCPVCASDFRVMEALEALCTRIDLDDEGFRDLVIEWSKSYGAGIVDSDSLLSTPVLAECGLLGQTE